MINTKDLQLKKLRKNDLKTLVDWAKEEGWNPGKYDFEVFWDTDPEGFYGFYFEQRLITGGAIVSYHKEFGFMGLFIVHPDFRGQGIGQKLWFLRKGLLLKRLKNNATIGMDGVLAMQPFYEKGGFKIAFKDVRYEFKGQKLTFSKSISTIEKLDIETVHKYDLKCFGYNRNEFLKNWLKIPESKSFKFLDDDNLKGYAVIRKVNTGYKIGPLFADTDEIAEELLKACLNSAIDASIYFDIPVINKGAVNLVKKYNAKYTFECARMYYGDFPKVDTSKIYGITTFELG